MKGIVHADGTLVGLRRVGGTSNKSLASTVKTAATDLLNLSISVRSQWAEAEDNYYHRNYYLRKIQAEEAIKQV